MLSFLRPGSSSSRSQPGSPNHVPGPLEPKAITPTVIEPPPPPPSASARMEKEKSWYASIRGKGGDHKDKGKSRAGSGSNQQVGGSSSGGIGHTAPRQSKDERKGGGEDSEKSGMGFLGGLKNKRSQRSLKLKASSGSLQSNGSMSTTGGTTSSLSEFGHFGENTVGGYPHPYRPPPTSWNSDFVEVLDEGGNHTLNARNKSTSSSRPLTRLFSSGSSIHSHVSEAPAGASTSGTGMAGASGAAGGTFPSIRRTPSVRSSASNSTTATLSTSEGFTLISRPPPNPNSTAATLSNLTSNYSNPLSLPGGQPHPRSILNNNHRHPSSSPSTSSSPPVTTTTSPGLPSPDTDNTTKSLANRLQDLATSHADGLLDDEEYRILRSEIFERFSSAPDPPPENQNKLRFDQPQSRPATPPDGRSQPPSLASTSRRSRLSRISAVSSIFRRNTRTSSQKGGGGGGGEFEDGSSSRYESNSAYDSVSGKRRQSSFMAGGRSSLKSVPERSIRGGVTGSRLSTAGGTSPNMSDSQLYALSVGLSGASSSIRAAGSSDPPRSSTIRSAGPSFLNDDSNSLFPAPPRTSYSNPASRASRSPSMSGGRKSSGRGGRINSISTPDLNSDLESPAEDPSSDDLRQEINDLEVELARLVDSFQGLEMQAYAKYNAMPTSHGLSLPPGEAPALPTELEPPRPSFRNGENVGKRPRTSSPKPEGSKSSFSTSKKDRDSLSTDVSRTGSVKAPLRKTSSGSMRSRAGKPSSRSHHIKEVSSTGSHRLSTIPSARNSMIGRNGAQQLENSTIPEENLEAELEQIRLRRRGIEDRYETRLEYLRARLRGALIKEGLPR